MTVQIYLLVFAGWLIYWLKKLMEGKTQNKDTFSFGFYFKDNWMEMIFSAVACVLLVWFDMAVHPVDTASKIADFTLGLGAGTSLNGIITSAKPNSMKPVLPVILIFAVVISLSSCSASKSLQSAFNKIQTYAEKHDGQIVVKQETNGAISTKIKMKGVYNADPVKKVFTRATLFFDAVSASFEINTTTTDTTLSLKLPEFGK